MKSIALYARVSSEQQAQQATVDSQLAALKQRAEADGHMVLPDDVYVDVCWPSGNETGLSAIST